jgi:DNA polymerase-1
MRDFSREARGYQYTEALNTPIQGGAAEVMLAALARLQKHFESLDAKLVNVVHDEIVLEVAKRDAPRTEQAVEKAMIEGMLAMFPDASTVGLVEAKAGVNWAEVK